MKAVEYCVPIHSSPTSGTPITTEHLELTVFRKGLGIDKKPKVLRYDPHAKTITVVGSSRERAVSFSEIDNIYLKINSDSYDIEVISQYIIY